MSIQCSEKYIIHIAGFLIMTQKHTFPQEQQLLVTKRRNNKWEILTATNYKILLTVIKYNEAGQCWEMPIKLRYCDVYWSRPDLVSLSYHQIFLNATWCQINLLPLETTENLLYLTLQVLYNDNIISEFTCRMTLRKILKFS